MLSQLLGTDQLVGSLADVGKKEIEGLGGAHEQLAHSFLSEHPARSSLRKKDIRVMQSVDHQYSLELSLTLATLVRHQDGDRTICPTPLIADPEINIYTAMKPESEMQTIAASISHGEGVAGLTTLRSTVASGHLRFGSWCLAPHLEPPRIFTFGLRLDLKVRSQII
jgi:hypothetical protein